LLSSCPAARASVPIVVGEAMAGGVPCLVTDGVDSAEIVGTTGLVVPPADPLVLGEAWRKVIEHGPEHGGRLGDLTR
jgi:glycosyltransferase involved in cell wall biosynthesis